jgi:hypothetical protein
MAGKSPQKINRSDLYKQLLKNYLEWQKLISLLAKEEKNIRKDFLNIVDRVNLEKAVKNIKQ